MEKLKNWLIAIRPFGFTGTLIPTAIGGVLAYSRGIFNSYLFFITMAAFLLIHTGTNLINDYYDYLKGIDSDDSFTSSGLRRVKNNIKISRIYQAGVGSFLLSIPFLIYIASIRGSEVLIFGGTGILAGFFYTAPPINYKYYGLGVPSVFIFMGPVIVWGSYFIQTGEYSWLPVLISFPVAFLIAVVLFSNEIRDIFHDDKCNIHTIPILLGFKKSKPILYGMVITAYVILALLIISKVLPSVSLLVFITLIPAIKILKKLIQSSAPEQLRDIDKMMAKLHFIFGLVLIICLILSKIIP